LALDSNGKDLNQYWPKITIMNCHGWSGQPIWISFANISEYEQDWNKANRILFQQKIRESKLF
jgi:hypothetical protein